ncbi:MAG TPA: aldehyde dehydrogenase family protein [Jatrophihabitantaceae bacterium]|jgi:acyl-CoA reductase-like NAD-dependent aldehyde dehydrogenase|nr:aldehyde dehydrogenase family protein [Jatrophihabitantaceae bacterium]
MSEIPTETECWERVDEVLQHPWGLLVDGNSVPAISGKTFAVSSPVTETVIAHVPDAAQEDVDRAILAAELAFPAWSATPALERARLARCIADVLEENCEELALLDSVDGGAPVSLNRLNVKRAATRIHYYAGLVLELKGFSTPASENVHFTTRQPYGVVARITPFNHPILFAASRLAVPLIAGNCVVLKPADATPLSALYLGYKLRDVLPPGVLSVLVGAGPAVPRAIVRHPKVRRIAFTGSEPTGRSIMKDAAETGVKKVTLELGGKNALIAYPDADPEAIAQGAVKGMNFTWSGQSCSSTSRLIIHESVADEVVNRIVEIIEARHIASPLDPSSEQGTMATKAHYDAVKAKISDAVEDGAKLLTGGDRPAHLSQGLFIAPVVLDHVAADSSIAQNEVFGPVLSVIRFGDSDDPVAIANSVTYGLTGSVYTNDIRRAHRVARALECGYVWINGTSETFPGTPVGGWKSSGIGREGSVEELLDFTQEKTINIML